MQYSAEFDNDVVKALINAVIHHQEPTFVSPLVTQIF